MKRRRFIRPRDRNREAMYVAGRKARDDNRRLEDCPNLEHYVGDVYAKDLVQSWVNGWNARDRELHEQSRRGMKGAD